MLLHHYLGVISVVIGCIGGYANTGCLAMGLLMEVSTIFLNYRSMYDKSKLGEAIPNILFLLCFISYTIFRMMLMPYGLYLMNYNYNLVSDHMSLPRKLIYIFGCTQFVLLYIINLYWYLLVIRRILRIAGVLK
jgi:hypothetical protein